MRLTFDEGLLALAAVIWIGGSVALAQSSGTAPAGSVPQAARTTTGATNGSFSVTFARPFASATPTVWATPLGGSTAPEFAACSIDSIGNPTTAPVVSGHCSTTQQSTVGALGAVITPVQALASGTPVMVGGMDTTQ